MIRGPMLPGWYTDAGTCWIARGGVVDSAAPYADEWGVGR
jgi:hypothetical protein